MVVGAVTWVAEATAAAAIANRQPPISTRKVLEGRQTGVPLFFAHTNDGKLLLGSRLAENNRHEAHSKG